ncbi:hypothetical protein FFH90_024015 [Pseudomonas sp. ATCC 43928]|nr:hypothetical protein C1X70_15050 [Pseudomonas sp. FW305-53]PMY85969.1 hypothetical protein C1X68_15860 [Pseudomonas sp. FW303-C2]PMY92222.1 hypothetical protein C1X67_13830 [Pseudomonas sp. FW305-62]PNA41776.1 hypothetical protein C1X71_17630 [Pseudomonas sp. FW306-2-2C-A10BC]PNA84643.1 hypothetical protein C1X66_18960 [Pseudomonas sp. MPR-R3B]PNB20060.1 hypothetical protein C1X69_16425 [Pseudomonas sp. FW305-67]QDV97196.1 hypothetical protein FFH90_024015 [Pseudomonas sp. ATCC 43928]
MGRTPLENAWACRSIQGSPYPAGRVITDYYGRYELDWLFVARELAPAGARSGPTGFVNQSMVSGFATAAQPNGTVRRSDKLPRHRDRA